jgi:RimJ/RimL family protein N-acetyltransferase
MIEQDGASIAFSLVARDSETFGFTVAQIDHLDVGSGAAAGDLLADFDLWCAAHDVRFVSCRVDHTDLAGSMALEAVGFRFIETVLGPRLASLDGIGAPRHAIDVAEATPVDLDAIAAIAHSAFTTGRFILDQRLDPDLSRRRYANWVRTSFTDPRHVVLKAEHDGHLVGFFVTERRADLTVYWHLTAMAPEWQGQGMGMSLWLTMLHRHRTEGALAVETTISGHNLAAINLYARLGFAFVSTQMTFHRLRGPAA